MKDFNQVKYYIRGHASFRWRQRARHLHKDTNDCREEVEYAARNGQLILQHGKHRFLKYEHLLLVTYVTNRGKHMVITVLDYADYTKKRENIQRLVNHLQTGKNT